MSERTANLHCRMRPDEVTLLDELAKHFDADDRSTMIRVMMKEFKARMLKELAKRPKESAR